VVKPVIVVVDDEADSLVGLVRELESRYGSQYRIVASGSAEEAFDRLGELRAEGTAVPLVLADQWMPATTGVELLAQVHELLPTTRRGLLISWGDRSSAAPILRAAELGQIEFFLPKPASSPDEQFHLAVTESLEEWWRQRGGLFEVVTVIGEELQARSHEIRDLLTRSRLPFGFRPRESAEGRAALQHFGVRGGQGPMVALDSGLVLMNPTNAELGAALGLDVRPTEHSYDVVIVGAGPPAWPVPCTGRRRVCTRPCWSGRRSAAKPAPAR
jgi:thioredoxin reductase (NADPH)